MNIPTSKYKIIKAKIFLIVLYTSLYSANFTEQIILATGKNPHFIQTDFRYPGANSKIKVNDYYFETFQWKVASNKSDKIHVKINQIIWKEMDPLQTFDFNISIPEIDIIQGVELGCPVKSVIFTPWRLFNGKLEYAFSFKVNISYSNKKISLSNIPGEIINPETINLQLNTLPEYLILAPDNFENAALNLKSLHQNEIDEQFRLQTEIYLISNILDEISSTLNYLTGQEITNFLTQKINENPSLKYLLIFGDETYFPPQTYGSIPSDDLYTWNQNNYPQLATGRIPVSESFEAEIVVDKIRNYLLNPQPGIWRQKIALVADDHRHPDNSTNNEFRHTTNSEDIMHLLKNDVHLHTFNGSEYEPAPGSGWITLPQMTSDLIQTINSGVAILNYIGHGSPTTLAHEQIIDMNRDLSIINPEQGKEAIWVVGTCKFGNYDNEISMSEELLKKQTGAISLITTSRSVGEGTNDLFLNKIFSLLSEYLNNQNNYRLGEIFYHTKSYFHSANYAVFHLFGDPALILPLPQINNILNIPDSSDFYQMADQAIPIINSTTNEHIITITGPEWTNQIFLDDFNTNARHITHPGNIYFQSMLNESSTIFLPIDIPQCENCLDIKLYEQTHSLTGSYDYSQSGSLFNNPNSIIDNIGPEIKILKNNHPLTNGSMIYKPANIQITFVDESGINLSGGIGHGLILKINDDEQFDLNQLYYISSEGVGTVDFIFPNYLEGINTIFIQAWDNANNSSILENTFHFSAGEDFQLSHVFPYPNPFKREVEFTFQLSEIADIEIFIYSLAGDQIAKIIQSNIGPGFIRLPWNAKNKWNRIISNGTYIYTVKAKNKNGKIKTQIQKLVKIE